MRDLHLFGDASLTIEGVHHALGAREGVRWWPERGQVEVRDGDDLVVVREVAAGDLPVDHYDTDELDRIRAVVGDSWNPLSMEFRGLAAVDAVLRRIAAHFTVVIDTDHGHLIRGEDWAGILDANPGWDLMSPLPDSR